MAKVKFISYSEEDTSFYPEFQNDGKTPHKLHGTPVRTLTLDVDGEQKTVRVADNVTDIDAYIASAARNLAIEADKKVKETLVPEAKANDLIADTTIVEE